MQTDSANIHRGCFFNLKTKKGKRRQFKTFHDFTQAANAQLYEYKKRFFTNNKPKIFEIATAPAYKPFHRA